MCICTQSYIHTYTRAPPTSVLMVLNELRVRGELCDMSLHVDDACLHAHKTVLSASSPYFRAMFTSTYAEASRHDVELKGVTASALEEIIRYFYTSRVDISTENVQELLQARTLVLNLNFTLH